MLSRLCNAPNDGLKNENGNIKVYSRIGFHTLTCWRIKQPYTTIPQTTSFEFIVQFRIRPSHKIGVPKKLFWRQLRNKTLYLIESQVICRKTSCLLRFTLINTDLLALYFWNFLGPCCATQCFHRTFDHLAFNISVRTI